MYPAAKRTADGIEIHFGTNHIGHFYLTQLLLPVLRRSAHSRVVVVSSELHTTGVNVIKTFININLQIDTKLSTDAKLQILTSNGVELNNDVKNTMFNSKLYNYSKLCNILFVFGLHRRENANGINTYVLHPGVISTGMKQTFIYSVFQKSRSNVKFALL
jgi:NAD(P)-dependent dehydrogenase (short-subunit alcohol dehydrogenase family)